MFRALFKLATLSMCTLGLSYVVFFVPLGQKTLFEHLSAIIQTNEAQELGTEIKQVSQRGEQAVRHEIEKLARRSPRN